MNTFEDAAEPVECKYGLVVMSHNSVERACTRSQPVAHNVGRSRIVRYIMGQFRSCTYTSRVHMPCTQAVHTSRAHWIQEIPFAPALSAVVDEMCRRGWFG